MIPIQQAIEKYYCYIEDAAYIEGILTENDQAAVCDALIEMLRSSDEQLVYCASLFIRDVALLPNMGETAKRFSQQYIYSAELIQSAEAILFSPNHFIRRHSVYLLAKLCSFSSAGSFQHAFDTYKDSDPLLVPDLIFELQWLRANNYWQLLDETASSSHYLTRWAGMGTTGHMGELDQPKLEVYLQLMAHDIQPLVRTEAEYKLNALNRLKKTTAKLSLSFDDVEIRFSNNLHQQGRTEYTIAELDQFVQTLSGGSK